MQIFLIVMGLLGRTGTSKFSKQYSKALIIHFGRACETNELLNYLRLNSRAPEPGSEDECEDEEPG